MKFNLKKFRLETGLSQSQLADKMHVSRSAIARWENGFGYPELENFKMLSVVLKVPMDQLLVLDNEHEPNYLKYKQTIDKKLSLYLIFSTILLALCFIGGFSCFVIYFALLPRAAFLIIMMMCFFITLLALIGVGFFSFLKFKNIKKTLKYIVIVLSFGISLGLAFFVIAGLIKYSYRAMTPVMWTYMTISIILFILGLLLIFALPINKKSFFNQKK
ncbi:MAG: helix-turn-helix transcriptional regulator [Bacilli bacterium]